MKLELTGYKKEEVKVEVDVDFPLHLRYEYIDDAGADWESVIRINEDGSSLELTRRRDSWQGPYSWELKNEQILIPEGLSPYLFPDQEYFKWEKISPERFELARREALKFLGVHL